MNPWSSFSGYDDHCISAKMIYVIMDSCFVLHQNIAFDQLLLESLNSCSHLLFDMFFLQCCHPILMGRSRTIPIVRHKAWNTPCLSNVRARSLWLWGTLGIGRGEEKSKAIVIQTLIHLHNISWYKQHACMSI